MAVFDFYLDTKVTTWYRTNFEIEADSEEEAKQQAIEFVRDDKHSDLGWFEVDDTIEPMSVKDNGGQSTQEIFLASNKSDSMIWDNLNATYHVRDL
jgi:hypothetical protein